MNQKPKQDNSFGYHSRGAAANLFKTNAAATPGGSETPGASNVPDGPPPSEKTEREISPLVGRNSTA